MKETAIKIKKYLIKIVMIFLNFFNLTAQFKNLKEFKNS